MNHRKIAFTTLGCKVNLYDTEAMMELFFKKGYEIVDFDEFADIYIINTCTVTNFGDKKSRQMIRRAKRQNPNSIVAATGCYAQVASEEVSNIEGINIVIGTKERSKIVEIIENYASENGVLNAVGDIMGEHEFEPLSITNLKNRTRAYIKIQEGCNRFCTYCIIPFARGPVRSRKPNEVIDEVIKLAQNGFKEVVLTGIHVASYGKDLDNMDLIKIIKMVHEVDGIERIRFSSVEPLVVTDRFVSEMKKLNKVCDHYHLSLQSGCDKTLKKMNRHYTSQQYEEAVLKLREAFPDVAITTDIIVGFPGENEEDFEQSMVFAEKIKLSKIHSFPYSPKKGTAAAKFSGQLPNEIKAERSHKMIELSSKLNKEFLIKLYNKQMPVLFERCIGDNMYEGHTTNYVTVHTKSDDKNLINQIIDVKIGEIIGEETVLAQVVEN